MKKPFILPAIILGMVAIIGLSIWITYWQLEKEKLNLCPLEFRVCSDGTTVYRKSNVCEYEKCPKEDLIKVYFPYADELVVSPLRISGEAIGSWFFEANFPIKLLDANGNVLVEHYAEAEGEWMTEEFVEFSAVLDFQPPAVKTGTLVLEKNNPSGLFEHADELRVPLKFETGAPEKRVVEIYLYNPEKDKDELGNPRCDLLGLTSVEREIPSTITPIQDAVRLLLGGELTAEETEWGLKTEFPLAGFSLKGANLKEGVLTLEFEDLSSLTIGGSCRVNILRAQIEATAEQFVEVYEVNIIPEEILQP